MWSIGVTGDKHVEHWCECVWVLCAYMCSGRKVLVLLGDFNMAPDKEGTHWGACTCAQHMNIM